MGVLTAGTSGVKRSALPLIVLMSVPAPRPTTNPYITMLLSSVQGTGQAVVKDFGWRTAILGRYDVFHSHWPENLLKAKGPVKRLAKICLFGLFLISLSMRRMAVVQTVHNLKPHESLGRLDRTLLNQLDRMVNVRILINAATGPPDAGAQHTVVIPHGDYQDWFASYPRSERIAGTLAFVGLIKPYKGLVSLITSFRELGRPDLSLQISGMPSSTELKQALATAARGTNTTFDFSFQTDDQLVQVVTRAELIVLPYQEMYNSGAALLALSLDRPILVPDNPVTRALAAEVGETWVIRYGPPLTAAALDTAQKSASSLPAGQSPDLSGRSWATAGVEHLKAYRLAVALRSRR